MKISEIQKVAEKASKLQKVAELALKRQKEFRTAAGLAGPDFRPELSLALPRIPPNPVAVSVEENLASEFHKRLKKWISEFDASLDQAHEVGVGLVNFGRAVTFALEEMGYWNPSLIAFSGRNEDGEPVELIQHVNQISMLLVRLPRKNPDEPKPQIGFQGK